MANHGFVTTRRILTPEVVDKDIREIVKRRFKDEVEVTLTKHSEKPSKHPFEGHEFWDIWALWHFEPKSRAIKEDRRHSFSFETWQMSHRKLEFRHPHGEWAWWAQMTIQNELAYKYDGTISDEGVEERWKVTPERLKKYYHYRDWVTKRYPGKGVLAKAARAALSRVEMIYVPEPLRIL